MARPVKTRLICGMPQVEEFYPLSGCQDIVILTMDEYEVIRLIDYLGFSQENCASQMNVARTTVQAIYDSARFKIADVLINGKRLKISGGAYQLCAKSETCCGRNCSRRGCAGHRCEHGVLKCTEDC